MRHLLLACLMLLAACGGCKDEEQPEENAQENSFTPFVPEVCDGTDDVDEDGFAGCTDTECRQAAPCVFEPADPADVAPQLPSTGMSSFWDRYSFLFTGDDPIQRDVLDGSIGERTIGVVSGTARAPDGQPIAGAAVTIAGMPEFGRTYTRADGRYDMALDAGRYVVVRIEKSSFTPVYRNIRVPSEDAAVVDEVVLTPLHDEATTVDFSGPTWVAGTATEDDEGQRQTNLFVPAGRTAELIMPGGERRKLERANIRVTEVTVGEDGPNAMGGELPNLSRYTFAAEFTVDEAVDAGADHVEFDAPVYAYVDNFIGFEPGAAVPAGWFDRTDPSWKAAPNGVVLRVASVAGGKATLEAPDRLGQGALDDLGVSEAELMTLGEHYEAGDEVWRVPLRHFTQWDLNFPGRYPPGFTASPRGCRANRADCNGRTEDGSIIDCDNQTLGEVLPLNGTPLSLVYDSGRVPGRLPVATIPVRAGELAPKINRIDVTMDVAGVRFEKTYDTREEDVPAVLEWTWDRRDRFGRLVQGATPANTAVTYHYDLDYIAPPSGISAVSSGLSLHRQHLEEEESGDFLQYSTSDGTAVSLGRDTVQITRYETIALGGWDVGEERAGGWTLDLQHRFDPNVPALHFGGGADLVATDEHRTLDVLAGVWPGDPIEPSPDGTEADQAYLGQIEDVVVTRDGSIYFVASPFDSVRRITPDGLIETVASPGAETPFTNVKQLVIAPDGLVYFLSDIGIHRIDEDGAVEQMVGGQDVDIAEIAPDTPATSIRFNGTEQTFDVARDGAIYFPNGFGQIVRVDTDGRSRIVAGIRTTRECDGVCGDGELAPEVDFDLIAHLRVLSDDTLIIVEEIAPTIDTEGFDALRRIRTDGIVETLEQFDVADVHDIEVHPVSDELFVAPTSGEHHGIHVFRIGDDGSMEPVVGRAIPEDQLREFGTRQIPDGSRADTQLYSRGRFTISPRGEVVFANFYQLMRMRELLPTWTGRPYQIPSFDGEQVYQFHADGRHDKTRDAWTGAIVWEFEYDDDGLLTAVIDRERDATRIARDADGNVSSITGPDGVEWTFEIDADGWLSALTSPEDERWEFEMDDGGLLTGMTAPTDHTWTFAYDEVGRLVRDQDATLERAVTNNSRTVTYTSGEGRTTEYQQTRTRTMDGSHTTGNLRGETSRQEDGDVRRELPDGTVILQRAEPHPALGYTAAYPSMLMIGTPGGITFEMETAQTATLESDDLFGLAEWTESVTAGDLEVTSSWSSSRRFTVETGGGRTSTVTVDDLGRVTDVESPGEAAQQLTYDDAGRIVEITQGDRIWSISYDANGYPERIESPDGTVQLMRDAMGRVTRGTRPDMTTVGMTWDGMSNVTSVTPPERDDYTMSYNERRQPLTFVAPASDFDFSYNDDFQLTEVSYPDGRAASFDYDTNGRLASVTDPARTITVGYDDGTPGDFDGTGQLLAVQSDSGVDIEYAYDGFLRTDAIWLGDVEGEVSWRYGDQLRLEGISVNGQEIAYGYDEDGVVIDAGDQSIAYEAGTYRVTERELDSVRVAYEYDQYGQITNLATNDGLLELAYSYDDLGRVTQIVETDAETTRTFDYAYDAIGQLTEVRTDDVVSGAYTYDANGNRLSSLDVASATYSGEDELLSYGPRTYTYSAGQLTSMTDGATATTYDYSMSGELRSVDDGSTRIEYEHDGLGRRVGKRVDGAFVQGLLYQDALNPIAELDASGAVRSRFVYATRAHVPDYMIQNGRKYLLVTDHLGSVRYVIDTLDGSVAQRLEYDEFGQVVADSNPGFQPFGFAGGLYDPDTGLVRFGVRDYDPYVGRWTSRDPIAFDGGQANLHLYVANSPQSSIDPTGRAVWAAVLITGGLAGLANALSHRGEGRDTEARAFWNGAIGGATAALVGTGAAAFSVGAVACGALGTGAGGAVTKSLDLDHHVDEVTISYTTDVALAAGLSALGGALGGAFAPAFPGATKPMTDGADVLTPLGIGLAETASNGALLLFDELAGVFEGI